MQTDNPEIAGLQRFTDNAKKAVISAHDLAERHRNPEVTPLHLFIGLLSSPGGLINKILQKIGLDQERTQAELHHLVELKQVVGFSGQPVFSEALKETINKSFLVAEELGHVYVGTEHLLVAMLDLGGEEFIEELKQLGMTSAAVMEMASTLGNYPGGVFSQRPSGELDAEVDSSLPFFCRDMNQQASRNEFLNITGRDKEIERMIHILARKTKNNPILVGDAGVGKTAVVQGLVQRIVRGNVPPSFIDKQVLSLDVSAIIAGARVRGDVEERILALVNDAIAAQNKIIFIDEIHMIVGSGGYGARDPMDIGNILKPYLTDPNLRIIGATTVAEFRRYFDDDPALSRRFQPIDVEELDKESSTQILQALRPDLEEYHGVKIKDEAIKEAVELSAKFITDRFLPDKAIDLIDEAAASVKIGREISIEPALSELGDKLMNAQRSKELAMENKDLASAYRFQQSESQITDAITDLVEGGGGRSRRAVDANMIRKIVVNWTKIPLAAAAEIGPEGLDKLKDNLSKHIVGQEQVLQGVSDTLKRSHLRLTDSHRPLASFLFLGPTGVGKTELAKSIATELFGSADLIYQINMSEYMEMHSVAKLIGSPPGYVGYQEGGQLTERVRRHPYTVILFDEIEKAHPDVLNLLLQILEEGQLTDGKGRKATFQNTVVVLTSNIGAEDVARDKRLGFDVEIDEVEKNDLTQAYAEMRETLLESLKEEVRPEILNRLDSVVVFRGLNEQDCLEISRLMVRDLQDQLVRNGIDLSIPPAVVEHINKLGYSKEYGARNIRRQVQESVENPLADYLITAKLKRPKKTLLRIKCQLGKDGLVQFKLVK